jgi:RHS repeat-associated protein
MKMPGRYGNDGDKYKYGFQGQEMDDEMFNQEGNSYTAEYWQYDARLGRRWNLDPIVKVHESPYATFANNPIWFTDPNGADSSLYSKSSGELLNIGVTPEDDKTAIWTVDTKSKGYDSKNPWATAEKLTYSVGNGKDKAAGNKTGISGNKFRTNHPLYQKGGRKKGEYATVFGSQVFEEDLINMTSEFNSLLSSQVEFFQKVGSLPSGMKVSKWIGLVGTNGNYDLKSNKRGNLPDNQNIGVLIYPHGNSYLQIPSYSAISIGEFSFYGGKLLNNDDYGNISYGYWGNAWGYSEQKLTYGASWAQMFSTFSWDPQRDTDMVRMGFNLNLGGSW